MEIYKSIFCEFILLFIVFFAIYYVKFSITINAFTYKYIATITLVMLLVSLAIMKSFVFKKMKKAKNLYNFM